MPCFFVFKSYLVFTTVTSKVSKYRFSGITLYCYPNKHQKNVSWKSNKHPYGRGFYTDLIAIAAPYISHP